MQIHSTRPQRTAANPPQSLTPLATNDISLDSVTLSGGFRFDSAATYGALGVVPLVGAASNFNIGLAASMNDAGLESVLAGVGQLSNVGGTITLVCGLLSGNNMATKVGLGLLGLSGFTGAYAGLMRDR